MCAGTDQPGGPMNSNSKDWPLVSAVVFRNVIRSPVRGFSILSPRCAIRCLLALFPCSLRHNSYSTGRPSPKRCDKAYKNLAVNELRRISLPRTPVNKESLLRPPRLGGRLWTQPQRDVLRLHGVPGHLHHIVSQGIQVRLIAQPGAEGGKRLHGVVLASVEASVHETLYTPPKRVEQGGYCQRGSHDREGGPLTCEGAEDVLQADHPSEVDQSECGCQRAVDEGAIDEEVYIVEAVLHNRDSREDWQPEQA